MLRTLWTSRTGMNANQERLDVISNNLANSSTAGYKKLEIGFKDLLSESLDRRGYPIYDKTSIMGTGTRTTAWYRDGHQGNLMVTEIATDLCIEGEGQYFRLTQPDGTKVYTRDGAFKIDSLGRLVDSFGNKVDIEFDPGRNEENTPFTVDSFMVDTEGYVYRKENNIFNRVGKINLYTATGDNAFNSVGNNLFVPAEGADVRIVDVDNTRIHQGYLEGSNVDVAQEMTDMIVTQRAFQLSSKSLQTADDMWGMINNMRS
ncbi:MAG: flagellar basal body rod protein FlgG [Clostridiales bacterium]|nr:flagellar basal body rod protein FlgG [Clostridiales bacterium]